MKNISGVFVIAALLILYGCGSVRYVVDSVGVPVEGDSPYFTTLKQWTTGQKIYEGVEARLYIYATHKSAAFREAYVDEYARRYQFDDDMKRVLLQREREAAERYNEFFVAAYTPRSEWNDFEKGDSLWRLYLEGGSGERVSPVEVERLEPDQILREFFPYFDPWSVAYIVRFPRYAPGGGEVPLVGEGEAMKLIVTGIKGSGVLEWGVE
ncbi:MAG: hypothetical protein V3W31_00225 [Thermodesulfobacteriota bacterium]